MLLFCESPLLRKTLLRKPLIRKPLIRKTDRVDWTVFFRCLAASHKLAGLRVNDDRLSRDLVKVKYCRAYLLAAAAPYTGIRIDNDIH